MPLVKFRNFFCFFFYLSPDMKAMFCRTNYKAYFFHHRRVKVIPAMQAKFCRTNQRLISVSISELSYPYSYAVKVL
jgi:hypothetical protein